MMMVMVRRILRKAVLSFARFQCHSTALTRWKQRTLFSFSFSLLFPISYMRKNTELCLVFYLDYYCFLLSWWHLFAPTYPWLPFFRHSCKTRKKNTMLLYVLCSREKITFQYSFWVVSEKWENEGSPSKANERKQGVKRRGKKKGLKKTDGMLVIKKSDEHVTWLNK